MTAPDWCPRCGWPACPCYYEMDSCCCLFPECNCEEKEDEKDTVLSSKIKADRR